MKNKHEIALLVSLLIISLIPLVVFVVTVSPNNLIYIRQLLNGDAIISIDVAKDSFAIYSQIVYGAAWFSLSYIILLIGSTVVFWSSIALLVRNLLRYKLKQQRHQSSLTN